MHQWKRVCGAVLSATLAVAVTVSTVPADQALAKKKATLATKSINVVEGKSKVIRIKNKAKGYKYSFKSNKKSVAKVTKAGKVTGVKAGSAKITVTETKKKKAHKVGVVKVTVTKKVVTKPTTTPSASTAPEASATPVASAAASATPVASAAASVAPEASATPVADETPAPTKKPLVLEDSVKAEDASVNVYMDKMNADGHIAGLAGVGLDATSEKPGDDEEEEPGKEEVIMNLTFEDGKTEPLAGRGDAKINVVDGGAGDSAKALEITERTNDWHGLNLDVSKIMAAGSNYEISYDVKPSGDASLNVNNSFQIIKADGENSYPSLKTNTIEAGKWTHVAFTISDVPESSGETILYWQVKNDKESSFMIDNLIIKGVPKKKADAPDMSLGLNRDDFGNPAILSRMTADPFAMEYNGRIYVYGTNDSQEYFSQYASGSVTNNSYSKINTINCYSTTDFVNWTDHGAMAVAGKNGPASWATNSWAPAACHKTINGKEKFFLYFADNGSGIGVVTSDSPTGPWVDPIGKQLISRQTPTCSGEEIQWLFDPAVLVDDDGTGYLYFGGFGNSKGDEYDLHPNCIRVAKLNDDMVSIDGDPVLIDALAPFEDSGIYKHNGKYYYSYCTNFRPAASNIGGMGSIAVMESDNPMTGFEYIGTVLPGPTGGGNNHHAMFDFKGEPYIVFHSQSDSKKQGVPGSYYRATYIQKLNMGDNDNFTNANGSVAKTQSSSAVCSEGIPAVDVLNPYQLTPAETIGLAVGVGTVENNVPNICADYDKNMSITNYEAGSYIGLNNVDFGSEGATSITLNLTDTEKNEYVERTIKLEKTVTGVHNIYFVLDKAHILIDSWEFNK